MGGALCQGLLKNLKDVTVSLADHHPENLKPFSGIKTSTKPQEILGDADAVLIAVKPQTFGALCAELHGALEGKLVISIMAGKTLATLMQETGSRRVIRSMPNLGVRVGRGLTAWVPSSDVTGEEATITQHFFAQLIDRGALLPEDASKVWRADVEHRRDVLGSRCATLESGFERPADLARCGAVVVPGRKQ